MIRCWIRWLWCWLAGLLLAVSSVAASTPAVAADQVGLMRSAEQAEASHEPARAHRLYREALAVAPGSRLARRIRARLGWLEARAEDGFAPLAELMRARARDHTPESLQSFERRLDGFPAGRVRREAWQLVADTYFGRLHRPVEALRAYQRWAAEPGLTEGERHLAESGVALARARLGRLGDSLGGLDEVGLSHRAEGVFVQVARVRATLRWLCLAILLGFGAALVSLGRGAPRRPTGGQLLCTALAVAPPLAFSWIYDPRLLHDFAATAGACVAVLVTLLAGASRLPSTAPRRWLAAGAALSVVAAAALATSESGFLLEIVLSGRRG